MTEIPLDYAAVGVCIAAIAAYSLLHWFLGRRGRALELLEMALNVLVYVVVIYALFAVAARVCAMAGLAGLPDSRQVAEAGEVFSRVHELAVQWITRLVQLRLILSVAPFTYPVAQALYSATGWQRIVFEAVAAAYLAMAVYAKVLAQLMPLLLPLGSTLTCIPRVRRLGATLLAAYLSAIPVALAAALTESTLKGSSTVQPINATAVGEAASKLGPSWNPLSVADEAAKAAWRLAEALVRSLITMALGSSLAGAVALALGGVYVHLRTPF